MIGARWLDLLEARAESGERDYVREEIAAALAARIVVIPVLMDRAPLPKAASLPEDIRELALYHKHDVVYESFGRDVQALIAAIEAHRLALNGKAASAARLTREKEQAAPEAERRARQAANEEAARLALEQEQAEIETARRARQKAKEEAQAERRAQQKEVQAKPRPEPADFPWAPVVTLAAVAAVVILLIAQPWQRGLAPAVQNVPHPVELAASGLQIANTKTRTGFSPKDGPNPRSPLHRLALCERRQRHEIRQLRRPPEAVLVHAWPA